MSLAVRAAGLVAALAATLALTGCTGTSGADPNQAQSPRLKTAPDPGPSGLFRVSDRRAAPTIAGTTLDGERLDVASLRGQVVVLNFWASWCAPCRAEAPNLSAVAGRYRGRGVSFVGVAVKDDKGTAQAFERSRHTPYPSLFDQPGIVLTRFHALAPQTPPTTLLLDRQGRVAGRLIGGVTEGELDGSVRTLMAEPT